MFVDLPTFEAFSVTFIVTVIRTILEASPTMIGGVVVAAWLRTQATPERLKDIFRGHGIHGVFRMVLVGMALPVCSIGVLPVLRELRRLGLPTSKLITLAIAAPLLNPITLLYGLTALSATQFFLIICVTWVLAIIISDVSSRFALTSKVTAQELPLGLTGGTRIRNLLVASGKIATGWPLVDLLMVIFVSGITIALIPSGSFATLCDSSYRAGSLLASLLAFPQYVGPARGVIQCAAIERVDLSVLTGLVIYVFGVGLSPSNIILLTRWYGFRRVIAVVVTMFLFVSVAVYSLSSVLLAPARVAEETTGLNGLARPTFSTFYQIGEAVSASLWFTDPLMLVGTLAFWICVLVGGVVRLTKVDYRNDDPEAEAKASTGRMSKAVPASQLGVIAVFGIGIFFCLVTYVFMPSPSECLEEMQMLQMDTTIALRSGNVHEALNQIAAWDSFAAKLPVSAAVYWSFPTVSQRQATRDLRMELYSTRALLHEGDVTSARKKIPDLMRVLSKIKETFPGSSS